MTAPTAGSGMKWVGRAIRRLEDPALVTGRGRFTADLNASPLGALRPQPRRLRPHRRHHRAGRSAHRIAPPISTACGRSGRCCTSSTISRSSSRSWRPTWCALSASRSRPSSRRSPAEAEDIAEAVEIEIAELPAVVDAQEALKPDAPRSTTTALPTSWSKAASRPQISTRRSRRRTDASASVFARAARMRRRSKRARRMRRSIRRRAA